MATYQLTSGDDVFTGTTSNDIFIPPTITDNGGTDTIDGGEGIDSLIVDYGAFTPDAATTAIFSDTLGQFNGSVSHALLSGETLGLTQFTNIEQLTLTLGGADDTVFVDARSLGSGALLEVDGGAGLNALEIDYTAFSDIRFIVSGSGISTGGLGVFSNFEDIALHLSANSNTVELGTGWDLVFAELGGNNDISTGDGFDEMVTTDGVNVISGGAGYDLWESTFNDVAPGLTFTINGTSGQFSDGSSATGIEVFDILVGPDGGGVAGAGNDTFNVSVTRSGAFDGGDGEDTFNADFSGMVPVDVDVDQILTDKLGGFTGARLSGLTSELLTFHGMEHVRIKQDDLDNFTYVDALYARSGGTLALDGGFGNDTVQVTGVVSGWSITANGSGGFVLDDIDLSDGDYGQFTVRNVENIAFDDTTYDLAALGTGLRLGGDDGPNKIAGEAFDDVIEGFGDDDFLFGAGGIDTLSYANAADGVRVLLYRVGTAQDTLGAGSDVLGDKFENLVGSDRNDGLWGNDLANFILGLDGDDRINGMSGADRLEGGLGNDAYTVDDAGDIVVEYGDEGYDAVFSSISYALADEVERLQLTGSGSGLVGTGNDLANVLIANNGGATLRGGNGDDALYGGTSADTLLGGSGNDRLEGRGGADVLAGGTGDDSYHAEAGDTLTEYAGDGIDTVYISATHALGANLERLVLQGTGDFDGAGNALDNAMFGNVGSNQLGGGNGADRLFGRSGSDALTGGSGNDRLDGGSGADAMTGGTGDDTYLVDDSGDSVTEGENEGVDLVGATITHTLADNVERLRLLGTGAIDGTGNALNNVLAGNGESNVLSGLGGTDALLGHTGDDVLIGGTGRDTLIGGIGADAFVFDVLETSANRDRIADFEHGTDTIALSAAVFTALAAGEPVTLRYGAVAATAEDRLIYNQTTGVLAYDADGTNTGAALVKIAVLTGAPTLDAADLLITA